MNRFFIIISIVGFFLSTDLKAQERTLTEDEVSFSIQKWFYSDYPKSTEIVWTETLTATKERAIKVAFTYQESAYEVMYDMEAKKLSESKMLNQPLIDLTIVNYVADNFEKGKIKSVQRAVDMQTEEVVFIVDVKSKSNGPSELKFDSDFNLLPNNNFVSSSN